MRTIVIILDLLLGAAVFYILKSAYEAGKRDAQKGKKK